MTECGSRGANGQPSAATLARRYIHQGSVKGPKIKDDLVHMNRGQRPSSGRGQYSNFAVNRKNKIAESIPCPQARRVSQRQSPGVTITCSTILPPRDRIGDRVSSFSKRNVTGSFPAMPDTPVTARWMDHANLSQASPQRARRQLMHGMGHAAPGRSAPKRLH
ncbi:hypothetical protein E2C01_054588 [Portunus trituberculatus]|uniref:Uncharacterized protein n=1 Tax=Portunus trituberculatus TaxID=210409 RepID=A0A5B7GK06_PORTR|nr:hypothetical protein [Portunus trituberculatus]